VLAHGLVQRSSLPIPEWLFGWAAAAVLCVSFVALAVLWPKPRLEDPGWRPLPGGLGAVVGSRAVEVVGGVIGVAALALVIVAGYVGPDTPLDNFAPTFVFIIFWVGLVFVSVLLGDVFRLINPWRALGRVLFRGREPRPYPERLGRWPATAGLFVFTWIELASGWGEEPVTLATAVLVYSVLTLGAIAVYGVEPWIRHGETFSVYFNLFARLSVFETRDRVVGVRPLLGGLPRLDPVPGTVALVAVMIGTVTFDGLSQGQLWKDLAVQLNDGFEALGFGLETTPKLVATVGLAIGVAIAGGFYALGIEGARSVGGGFDSERLRRAFVHSLVPIAMVYVAAHYLTFLLFEGQSIFYLASDPFGQGWDLFGTANSAIDYGLLSQNTAWYLQVGFVVLGHVAALVLAHDRALALYGDPKFAVRSQYWMLAIMVGFTSLALWLLAQAGA
ncbi:MAG TPA: fenitrothion hydrolase, partial [Solirubrobacteraceae bacterium]|nr:fenitrothion hydrolase [Solirubrobacteraceae bacterium]